MRIQEKRAETAENKLAQRNEKVSPLDAAAELIQYHAQSWDKSKRQWRTIGDSDEHNEPFDNWRQAEKFILDLKKDKSPLRYRIVPANLPVKEYK
ncbi:hypothetical protein D9M71_788610 [compost metagenome]